MERLAMKFLKEFRENQCGKLRLERVPLLLGLGCTVVELLFVGWVFGFPHSPNAFLNSGLTGKVWFFFPRFHRTSDWLLNNSSSGSSYWFFGFFILRASVGASSVPPPEPRRKLQKAERGNLRRWPAHPFPVLLLEDHFGTALRGWRERKARRSNTRNRLERPESWNDRLEKQPTDKAAPT